jgi:hypothetical protein
MKKPKKFLFRVVAQTYQSMDILAEDERTAIDLFHNIQYHGSDKAKQTLEDSTSYEVEAYQVSQKPRRLKKGEEPYAS